MLVDFNFRPHFHHHLISHFTYPNSYFSYSSILVPGTSLLGTGLMGVVYLLWLGYLFVGIAIISDIFME